MKERMDELLALAATRQAECKFADAEALYREALQHSPDHPEVNYRLGQLQLLTGEVTQARLYLRNALSLQADSPQYWLSYIEVLKAGGTLREAMRILQAGISLGLSGGRIEELAKELLDDPSVQIILEVTQDREAGRYREAIQCIARWLEANPSDGEGFAHLCHLYSLAGDAEAARKAIDRACALAPASPVVQRNLARIFLKQPNPPAALEAASAAYRENPFDFENQVVLAAAWGAVGRVDDALALLDRLLAQKPAYAEALATRAMLRLRKGDIAGAKTDAEEALVHKPHLLQLWPVVSMLRLQTGDREGAMAGFTESLRHDPDNINCLLNLGELKRQAGVHEEAIHLLHRATTLAPNNLLVAGNLGVALHEARRLNEAEAVYRAILEAHPGEKNARKYLAVVLKELGRNQEALRLFGEIADEDGNDAANHANLGVLQFDLKLYSEAESSLRRAIDLDPALAEAYNTLANVLREIGDMEQALAFAEKAVSINPDLPATQNTLGNLLKETGDFAAAEKRYALAYQLNPRGFAGLDAAVKAAVLSYLQSDHARSRELLALAEPVLGRSEKEYRPTRIYHRYLTSLLASRDSTSAMEKAPGEVDGNLYVIGESHSLSAHDIVLVAGKRTLLSKSFWIEGCKQWHLGAPRSNKYKWQFERIMKALPPQSDVLLIIGEIDCRWDGGMMKAIKKSMDDDRVEKNVALTVLRFLDYLNELKMVCGHRLVVCGVPATNATVELEESDKALFLSLLRTFNDTLKREALAREMGFLDVFGLTDRGDGITHGRWHIDTHHLRPDALQTAFKTHYVPAAL
jgi:tetratricopeptide (TPR) repeat protein